MDDPYCKKVMELSALPFLFCSFSALTVSFHSSLPHFKLRKPAGKLSAVNGMSAVTSYVVLYALMSVELKRKMEGGDKRNLDPRSKEKAV